MQSLFTFMLARGNERGQVCSELACAIFSSLRQVVEFQIKINLLAGKAK